MRSSEYLDISNCPKCSRPHRYRLDVDRAVVLKVQKLSDMAERERQVRFVRLFTCPVKNEEFEARFVLTDTSSDRITSVNVTGAHQ